MTLMTLEMLLDTMSDSELIILEKEENYKNVPIITDEADMIREDYEQYLECEITETETDYIQFGAFNRPAIKIVIDASEIEDEEDEEVEED